MKDSIHNLWADEMLDFEKLFISALMAQKHVLRSSAELFRALFQPFWIRKE
jgi:hypothetical protein